MERDSDDAHVSAPSPTEETPEIANAASVSRARVRRFLLVILAIQLIVPPLYYLRDDPYDERFAWRMFSGIRMERCRVAALETREREAAIPLREELHVAWINHLRRNRRPVVERFLRARCERDDVQTARVVNECVAADRTRLPLRVTRIDCESGDITRGDR